MTVLLVRHARAGRRDAWHGDDRLRPLTKRGWVQAEALPVLVSPWLGGGKRPLLVSSPWLRCMQTLQPIATATGLEVTTDDALGEGMGAKAVASFAAWVQPRPVVICTHGDVIEEILSDFARGGLDLGDAPRAAKGSIWVLCGDRLPARRAEYVAPA